MNKGFVFSCENDQEFTDLDKIAKKLTAHGFNAAFFDVSPLLGRGDWGAVSYKTYKGVGIGKNFKLLSAPSKMLLALVNALLLVRLYYKAKAGFLLIGTPLLVYRLARIITFGNLKTVSVIRGVIAHSEEGTSLSSKVFMRSGKLGRSRFFRSILSDYYSDLVLCTGEVTRNFLLSRGVPLENIKVVGSIYCDSLLEKKKPLAPEYPLVVFVSSSFAFHGYFDAQAAQLKLIEDIKGAAHEAGLDFIIRKHPRDSIEYYLPNPDLLQCIDQSGCDPLLGYPSRALFMSTASTLIFEMAYAGRNTCFVADEFFQNRFSPWYKAVGVSPAFDIRLVIDNYLEGGADHNKDCSDKVISHDFKGGVLAQCVKEILICSGVERAK